MKICLLLLLLLIYLQGFCQNNGNKSPNYSKVDLAKNDSTFHALMDTAQVHLQTFIDTLNLRGRDTVNYRFGVKSDFVENGTHEHMWSLIFSFDHGDFKGIFIDSAFNVKNIKTGDKVVIHRTAIEDWVIFDRPANKQIGYYSEMYLNKKRN